MRLKIANKTLHSPGSYSGATVALKEKHICFACWIYSWGTDCCPPRWEQQLQYGIHETPQCRGSQTDSPKGEWPSNGCPNSITVIIETYGLLPFLRVSGVGSGRCLAPLPWVSPMFELLHLEIEAHSGFMWNPFLCENPKDTLAFWTLSEASMKATGFLWSCGCCGDTSRLLTHVRRFKSSSRILGTASIVILYLLFQVATFYFDVGLGRQSFKSNVVRF